MADQEHDTPGEPPAIRDEAADSPMWLPALGLSLLLLGAVLIVWRSANTDETAVEIQAGELQEETGEPAAADEPEAADDPTDAPQ